MKSISLFAVTIIAVFVIMCDNNKSNPGAPQPSSGKAGKWTGTIYGPVEINYGSHSLVPSDSIVILSVSTPNGAAITQHVAFNVRIRYVLSSVNSGYASIRMLNSCGASIYSTGSWDSTISSGAGEIVFSFDSARWDDSIAFEARLSNNYYQYDPASVHYLAFSIAGPFRSPSACAGTLATAELDISGDTSAFSGSLTVTEGKTETHVITNMVFHEDSIFFLIPDFLHVDTALFSGKLIANNISGKFTACYPNGAWDIRCGLSVSK
jgi:hypothetical protein